MLRLLKSVSVVFFVLIVFTTAGVSQSLLRVKDGGIVRIDHSHDLNGINILRQDAIQTAEKLVNLGLLPIADQRDKTNLLHPLKAKTNYDHYNYYGVSYFVDQDATYPGSISDYECGGRTYDTFEGNHEGTDLFLWPFWWNMMEEEAVEVVAAAPGWVVSKQDGYNDHNCSLGIPDLPNGIFIRHADGSQTGYLHLKKNTLTKKGVNEFVEAGEYLGLVGSSGNSSGPHLHLEFFYPPNTIGNTEKLIVDPYDGSCNSINESHWENQEEYYYSQLNRISSHEAAIEFRFEDCKTDIIHEQNDFCKNDVVWLYGFFRDVLPGQGVIHRIKDANSNTVTSWSQSFDIQHHEAFFYTEHSFVIPSDPVEGEWTYEIIFPEAKDGIGWYSHRFNVCNATTAVNSVFKESVEVYPNPVASNLHVGMSDNQLGIRAIELRDITGKVMHRNTLDDSNQFSLSTSSYPSGMYVLVFLNQSRQIVGTHRIIKH